MMRARYAILLDGGFVIKVLKAKNRRFPTPEEIVNVCENIKARPELAEYELLRIYFYHAPPCSKTLVNPIDKSPVDLSTSTHNSESMRLLDSLELKPNFSVRRGETAAQGWKMGQAALKDIEKNGARMLQPRDLVPNIVQKGVDLRIGLDMARLALREMVRAVVVITGDSDMVPAFKFARTEGVKVYLDHMGHSFINRSLKAHSDLVF